MNKNASFEQELAGLLKDLGALSPLQQRICSIAGAVVQANRRGELIDFQGPDVAAYMIKYSLPPNLTDREADQFEQQTCRLITCEMLSLGWVIVHHKGFSLTPIGMSEGAFWLEQIDQISARNLPQENIE